VTDHWGTTRTVIRAHEVDRGPDATFMLRLRLWPFHEFALAFRSMSLAVEHVAVDDDQPGAFLLADDDSGPG